jgi:hypothetical protein
MIVVRRRVSGDLMRIDRTRGPNPSLSASKSKIHPPIGHIFATILLCPSVCPSEAERVSARSVPVRDVPFGAFNQ